MKCLKEQLSIQYVIRYKNIQGFTWLVITDTLYNLNFYDLLATLNLCNQGVVDYNYRLYFKPFGITKEL